MRRTSKLVRTLTAISAMALIGTACASDEDPEPGGTETGTETPTGAAGGEVSTYIGEPEHLFPPNTNESEGIAVLRAIYKGLVDYDPETTEPFNQVAESIETTDEGKTYTITVADGWTFHDGSPVTAQSFVDAWNFAAYGPNGMQNNSFFSNFAGYEETSPVDPDGEEGPQEAPTPTAETLSGLTVTDEMTLTVELSTADPNFAARLGYGAYYPVPEGATDDPASFEQAPIGNGPYMVDESGWQHNESIRVVRYEDYAGTEPAKLDAIEFRIYADQNTAYNDLLAGNLDIMDSLPPERIEEAKTEFGDAFQTTPSSSITYIGFPSYVEWLTPEHRAALSMAIDREAITTAIFNGNRAPANAFISPVIPGSRESVCDNWTYNPDQAKQIWDDAGGYDGDIEVWFNSGAGHDEWVQAVVNQWQEVLGISVDDQVTFQSLDFAQYLPLIDNQEVTGPFRLGWGMDYPSPQNYLEPLFASYSQPPAGSNTTFYSNEEFDSLVAQGNEAGGVPDGIPQYQAAEDLICEDTTVAPVFFGLNTFAHSDRVENLYVDAFGDINYTAITVSE